MQGLRGIRPDRRLVGVEHHVTGCDVGDLAVPGEHVDLALPREFARLQPGRIDVDVGQPDRRGPDPLHLPLPQAAPAAPVALSGASRASPAIAGPPPPDHTPACYFLENPVVLDPAALRG